MFALWHGLFFVGLGFKPQMDDGSENVPLKIKQSSESVSLEYGSTRAIGKFQFSRFFYGSSVKRSNPPLTEMMIWQIARFH